MIISVQPIIKKKKKKTGQQRLEFYFIFFKFYLRDNQVNFFKINLLYFMIKFLNIFKNKNASSLKVNEANLKSA